MTSLDFSRVIRLCGYMPSARRDMLNQLGSELAAVLEDVSTRAALMPGISEGEVPAELTRLEQAIDSAARKLAEMRALLPGGLC